MKIVVKVGTSTLTHPTGCLNIRHAENLCKVLSDLKNAGNQIIMVSSGAIGMGVGRLSLKSRPKDMPTKQAAAAVGQCEMMYTYDRLFSAYGHTVAQILLTGGDLENGMRRENFLNTLSRLLELGALPIINENDTIVTDEVAMGETVISENDSLAAVVAVNAGADLLILLSDIDGLFTADPHQDPDATLISVVEQLTPDLYGLAGDTDTNLGTGGMTTKLRAAETVTAAGIDMVILNGEHPEWMYSVLEGKYRGTRFLGKKV